MAFVSKYSVVEFVNRERVTVNPFAYKGKVVAIGVKFYRMTRR